MTLLEDEFLKGMLGACSVPGGYLVPESYLNHWDRICSTTQSTSGDVIEQMREMRKLLDKKPPILKDMEGVTDIVTTVEIGKQLRTCAELEKDFAQPTLRFNRLMGAVLWEEDTTQDAVARAIVLTTPGMDGQCKHKVMLVTE